MEAAAAGASALQTINILTPSISLRLSQPCNIRIPNTNITRWRCSTQQNINSNSDFDPRPTVEHLAGISSSPPSHSKTPTSEPSPPSTNTQIPLSSSPLPSQGLVFDLGLKDESWDSHEIGSPVVKRFLSDEEERWYMWYHGCDAATGSESIGLAVSSNGVHWERGSGAVLQRSGDWWGFDTGGVRPSEVLVMSSARVRVSSAVYWLYYTGFAFTGEKLDLEKVEVVCDLPGLTNSFRCLPGLAISQDGRHWARIEGEHHSGALLDVGAEGEWDSLFIAAPRVVYHRSGDLRMYYHSYDVECGCFSIGMARSRDGIRWVKLGKVMGRGSSSSFDEAGVVNGHVVAKKDGGYVMVYEGIAADGRRSIGLAESRDGLKEWRRCGDRPILMSSSENDGEDGWDSEGVGCPCLVRMDAEDEWRLYYRGIGKEGRTGIGMAVSVSQGGEFPLGFKRWMGFHHV